MRAGLLVSVVVLVCCYVMGVRGGKLAASQDPADARLDTPPSYFIGEGTNELATTLLQGFVEEEQDFVVSPLGYSVTLAIMAEGARGETRNQLVSALHLPEDTYAVRQNYKAVLQYMREKWSMNKPEFKNWFYVYKNYTVDEAYKQVLLENYFTEVKHVDKVHYTIDFESEDGTDKGNKTEEQVTEKEEAESVTSESQEKDDEETLESGNKNTKLGKELSPSLYDGSKDVQSALTANPILDRDSKETELNPETKMIIFNGFYFRGVWKTQFKLAKEDEKQSFYITPTEKKQILMMQTSGNFNMGSIQELDIQVLELPYEGEQYSMLVLLPNQRDGLNKLIADITGFSLNKVYKYLTEKPVEVFLPKYQIQTISHPEKVLQKNGVTDVFTNEADLSGISSDKLRMGALVQLVNFQVDEGLSDTNFLTTTNAGEFRNNVEKFVADHPFLFFVRDHTKNIIVAAGKVVNPKFETDIDFSTH